MSKKLERLKEQYDQIEIPDELDAVVERSLKQKKGGRLWKNGFIGSAAAVVLFVAGLNASPAFAQSISEVPGLRSIVNVLTFKQYNVADGTMEANIQVPAIQNMSNDALEATLNDKYLAEGRKLYEEFIVEMDALKESGLGGHIGLDSGYVVKTDNDRILSIGRYVTRTAASSSTTFQYDTIDKQNELLIALPSLFKDDRYVRVISDSIKQQMIEQMEADPNLMYWVEGAENDVSEWNFKTIADDQNFYINDEHKLVIVFDKYEVAPGYMGPVEFTIPTDVIEDILAGRGLIK